MLCLVLYSTAGPEAEGVLFSDGKVVLNPNKRGADLEIYASIEAVAEAYRPERGFKIIVQPRG